MYAYARSGNCMYYHSCFQVYCKPTCTNSPSTPLVCLFFVLTVLIIQKMLVVWKHLYGINMVDTTMVETYTLPVGTFTFVHQGFQTTEMTYSLCGSTDCYSLHSFFPAVFLTCTHLAHTVSNLSNFGSDWWSRTQWEIFWQVDKLSCFVWPRCHMIGKSFVWYRHGCGCPLSEHVSSNAVVKIQPIIIVLSVLWEISSLHAVHLCLLCLTCLSSRASRERGFFFYAL